MISRRLDLQRFCWLALAYSIRKDHDGLWFIHYLSSCPDHSGNSYEAIRRPRGEVNPTVGARNRLKDMKHL
jgi:hypothetical protein